MARSPVVVDASVALKWVLDEPGSAVAEGLLEEDVLRAPDFLLVEVANVLWTKARRGSLGRSEAETAFDGVAAVPLVFTPTAELVTPARALAHAMDITVYDALYAALAQRFGCTLATSDRVLARAVAAAGLPGAVLLIE